MPDNWVYVFAAYGLAAFVLMAYWRHLVRLERDLSALTGHSASRASAAPGPRSDASSSNASRPAPASASAAASNSVNRGDERSQAPSRSGHPRNEPASRHPRQ